MEALKKEIDRLRRIVLQFEDFPYTDHFEQVARVSRLKKLQKRLNRLTKQER